MSKSQGEKNKELYQFQYQKRKEEARKVYDDKIYSSRLLDDHIKEADKRFAFRKKPMTSKDIMLFIILCFVFLLFGYYYHQNEDNLTTILFLSIIFFIYVGISYDVKSKFYIMILVLILGTLLIVSGTLTKGINIAINELNKKKSKNESNNKNNKK
tara:strand:+ start:137 stop:604 length:468 start_codon:yes stop_codon:yes gene_type:complete